MSGFVIAHVRRNDFVQCRAGGRDGDYCMNSARSCATVFPTREAAEAYAKAYVRMLTVVEPLAARARLLAPLCDGPYCPMCGTFLGAGYNSGDECLECFEKCEEDDEQKPQSSSDHSQKE
jgi:hypothetical protein